MFCLVSQLKQIIGCFILIKFLFSAFSEKLTTYTNPPILKLVLAPGKPLYMNNKFYNKWCKIIPGESLTHPAPRAIMCLDAIILL